MSSESVKRWQGKASAVLRGSSPEQVWPFFEDFCSFHKCLPSIDTCHFLDGINGQPGLIRYCSSTARLPSGEPSIKWCQEKLTAIDPVGRWLSYEIVDNNMGFERYLSTIKVIGTEGDGGCAVEWWFDADPIQGWSCEDLLSYLQVSLIGAAQNIEKAIQEEEEQHQGLGPQENLFP